MTYLCRRYWLQTELEDAVIAVLWEAGTLGCEVRGTVDGHLCIEAYFPPGTADPLASCPGVEVLGSEDLADRDWLAPWRAQARPFDLGRGFRVDPREPDHGAEGPQPPSALDPTTRHPSCGDGPEEAGGGAAATRHPSCGDGPRCGAAASRHPSCHSKSGGGSGDAPERRLLRLPARAAFGVGSHASTRLAMDLVEELPLEGRSVLDVGTGTGILAFAALHLGARGAVAFDIDPAAAFAARDNAWRNGFALRLFAGTATALRRTARFDWGLINVVPELILPVLPELASLVRRGLVLSGVLSDRGAGVVAEVERCGFVETGRAEDGEWVALRLERRPEHGAAADRGEER